MSAAGSPIEIDWPLTLAWWALGIALVAAFFAWRATQYSKLAYRLQRQEHEAGPAGASASDEELFVLRMIHNDGPLRLAFYVGEPGRETTSVNSWCFARTRQCVRGKDYVPRNGWFLETLQQLDRRNLVAQEHTTYRVTDQGAIVARKERDCEIHAPPLDFLPMQGG